MTKTIHGLQMRIAARILDGLDDRYVSVALYIILPKILSTSRVLNPFVENSA